MNVDIIAKKLMNVAKTLKSGRGELELFGLFLREDSDLWDVVIAAPWLRAAGRDSFDFVANKLREVLTDEELIGLSRIVILEHGEAVLTSLLEEFANKSGLMDVHFIAEGGAVIRKVYVLVACSMPDRKSHRKTIKQRRKKEDPQPSSHSTK